MLARRSERSETDITGLPAFGADQGASDLHLPAGLPPMTRADGDMRRVNVSAQDRVEVQALINDIMVGRQRKNFEGFLEIDFSFDVPGIARFLTSFCLAGCGTWKRFGWP